MKPIGNSTIKHSAKSYKKVPLRRLVDGREMHHMVPWAPLGIISKIRARNKPWALLSVHLPEKKDLEGYHATRRTQMNCTIEGHDFIFPSIKQNQMMFFRKFIP